MRGWRAVTRMGLRLLARRVRLWLRLQPDKVWWRQLCMHPSRRRRESPVGEGQGLGFLPRTSGQALPPQHPCRPRVCHNVIVVLIAQLKNVSAIGLGVPFTTLLPARGSSAGGRGVIPLCYTWWLLSRCLVSRQDRDQISGLHPVHHCCPFYGGAGLAGIRASPVDGHLSCHTTACSSHEGGPAEVTTGIDQVIWHAVDMNVVDDANPPVMERYKMSNLRGTEAGETVY